MRGALQNPVFRAWIGLIALSAGSAAVAEWVSLGIDRRLAGAIILGLALAKARVILADYLGLARAPTWRRGFNAVLGFYCLLLLGLYLM